MKYALYARKSSSSEDKQAQSIEDQLGVLRTLAAQRGLTIVAEYTEARSAKSPGDRPVFAQLINSVRSGEVDAILCWHVNRLFRNPVDFGTVSWLLQTGELKEILTPQQVHRTGDNVLLLSVESGMANQFVIDLRNVVARAMQSKVEKGIPPQLAPEGYSNNIHQRIIEADPERFTLIRKAWDLMLTGAYSVPQVLAILNNDWGYRTFPRRTRGGQPLSNSAGYRLFNNLFYTGHFLRSGLIHKGTYPPMVTLAEFERVQDILGRYGKAQAKKRIYPYTGLIRCGRCGCSVTAEVQKGHIYYHCTNARRICTKKGITQEQLDRQIMRELKSIGLDPDLEYQLLETIARYQSAPMEELQEQYKQVSRRLESCEAELGELVLMRARRLIDDMALTQGQERLKAEILQLRKSLSNLQGQLDAKHDSVLNAVNFATHVVRRFQSADTWEKRRIVQVLGASYVLTDKVLTLEKHPLLQYIADNKGAIERAIRGSESQKTGHSEPALAFGRADRTLTEFIRFALQYPFTEPTQNIVSRQTI